MDNSNGESAVLTVDEVAQVLRISRGHAFEMVRNGTIPSLKLGRRLLVTRAALERLLAGDAQQVTSK
jgi:excisionase family DNA binding protein